MFQKSLRGVAQVVERYFREVEAASSSLVTPIKEKILESLILRFFAVSFFVLGIKNFYLGELIRWRKESW